MASLFFYGFVYTKPNTGKPRTPFFSRSSQCQTALFTQSLNGVNPKPQLISEITDRRNNMSKTIYLFADVETTGTNFNLKTGKLQRNELLQIAYQLWNSDLTEQLSIDEHIVEFDNIETILALMDDYVTNMHTSTGLVDRLKSHNNTEKTTDIDTHLFDILKPYKGQGYRIILVGNNIQFDYEVIRRHLPQTVTCLHYALLDVSSIRRMFDILGSDFGTQTKANKASNHDAQTDIEECFKELQVYLKLVKTALEK